MKPPLIDRQPGCAADRETLLAQASGRVPEIGPATGLNLPRYSDTIDELILTEPEPGMRGRLGRRSRRLGCAVEIVEAPAERLPLPDASVDTVVSTLVSCTVAEPVHALRVLTPRRASCCSSSMFGPDLGG